MRYLDEERDCTLCDECGVCQINHGGTNGGPRSYHRFDCSKREQPEQPKPAEEEPETVM